VLPLAHPTQACDAKYELFLYNSMHFHIANAPSILLSSVYHKVIKYAQGSMWLPVKTHMMSTKLLNLHFKNQQK
jgi:hypothetical protein